MESSVQGVASHFVEILEADQASATRRTVVALAVAVLLAAPAYFLLPWQGLAVHAGAAVLGLLLGNLVAGSHTAAYESSLKGTWSQWMRYAVSCESVAAIHRRVRGRHGRNLPVLYAALLTMLWALEVILLFVAFQDTTSAALSLPVLGLNGALAGGLLGYYLRVRSWTRELRSSVSEMVDAGEIGVWGVV